VSSPSVVRGRALATVVFMRILVTPDGISCHLANASEEVTASLPFCPLNSGGRMAVLMCGFLLAAV